MQLRPTLDFAFKFYVLYIVQTYIHTYIHTYSLFQFGSHRLDSHNIRTKLQNKNIHYTQNIYIIANR